jgi:hypothetical protein
LKEVVTNAISYGVPVGGGVHEKEGERKKLKSAENETRAPRPRARQIAVLVSLRSPESQRSYQHSIDDFVARSDQAAHRLRRKGRVASSNLGWGAKSFSQLASKVWQTVYSAAVNVQIRTPRG